LIEEQKYLPRDDNNDHFFLDACDITKAEALEYSVSMYLKYISIFRELEECFNSIVHPQKREEIKETIILVIGRLIYLSHNLAKDNQESSDPCTFSSEYVSLSNHLKKLRILPYSIETPIPCFFKEDNEKIHAERNELIVEYTKMKLGVSSIPVEGTDISDESDIGNQHQNPNLGNQGNNVIPILSNSFAKKCNNEKKSSIIIQRCFRAYSARLRERARSNREQLFIGMADTTIRTYDLEQTLSDVYTKRKQVQRQNIKEYVGALENLKNIVREEEGYSMKSELSDERIRWVTEEIAYSNEIPDTLEKFYDKKCNTNEEVRVGGMKVLPKDSERKRERSSTNEKKDLIASIDIPAHIVHALGELVTRHATSWNGDLKLNNTTCFSPELAKDLIVRDQVRNEVLTTVDETLVLNLGRIRAINSKEKKGKRGKTGSKKKRKSSKNNKQKGVGNKEKPLPGSKIIELKKMDTAQMLSILIEHGIINTPDDIKIKDLIGSDYGDKECAPLDLTIYHVRKIITENLILPLGSQLVRDNMKDDQNIRSILLYGPTGCGKTAVAQAVANELGALFINLSPVRLKGKFSEKNEITKLVHMVFSVAKDPMFAPAVIYIDECEKIFQLAKNKKGTNIDGAYKFMKDILIYKNQSLSKSDRVILIGSTRNPGKADLKSLKWKGEHGKAEKQGCFEHFMYMSVPTYTDRLLLWKAFLTNKLLKSIGENTNHSLNLSTLAQFSSGYSAGAIKASAENVLSDYRIKTIKLYPLSEKEFIEDLKRSGSLVSHSIYKDFITKLLKVHKNTDNTKGKALNR